MLKYLIIFIGCLYSNLGIAENAKNNILIIHSYHSEHEWTSMLKKGFEDSFKEEKSTHLFHEFMDAKRYPQGKFKEQFLTYLQHKYISTNLSLIAVTDDSALEWVTGHRATFFPSLPIVYSGINQVTPEILAQKNMTGVFENRNLAQTVFDIKRMTGKEQLIVISDSSITGKINLNKIRAINKDPKAPKHIYEVIDLNEIDIATTLTPYSKNIPILVIGQLINPNQRNELIRWSESSSLLAKHTTRPIFTIAKVTLNNGATGAHELDGIQHAMQTSQLIKKILNGTEASLLQPILQAQSIWVLDVGKLEEIGINLALTPTSKVLINQKTSFYKKYKTYVWLTITAFSTALCIIILMAEIIRRTKQNQKILNINQQRYKDLAQAGANVFWETNQLGELCYISGNTTLFFNLSQQKMLNHTFESLLKNNNNIEFPWENYKVATEKKNKIKNLIIKIKLSSKDLKILMLVAKPTFDQNSNFSGYRGIIKDITQQHQLSERVVYQASYDQLTGLINRQTFNEKLKAYLSNKQNNQAPRFLCILDLDRFKLVNDSAGHLVGDAMLCEVATLIKQSITNKDLLARLGGDEFALLVNDSTLEQAQLTCEKIISTIRSYKFIWNERIFDSGISIGMVPITYGLNATELLSKADLACYKAKELGRGRVYITDHGNNSLYNEALQIGYIANISQAITNNQFFLVKQQIAPLSSSISEQAHYEILIRFKALDNKLIPPDLFIPAAEKNGLITLIDQWVVSTLLARYREFFPDNNTLVSINLSGISLSNEAFVQHLIKLIKKSDINAKNICFEITETAAISQITKVQNFIREMKVLGIKFAIDDFGSGASTYEYLKNLPADYLKIDGSLIKNIERSQVDQQIVKSINEIAHMMGMQTIAEFVENEQINQILETIGVNYVQGYHIGKPCPCDEK